ncbi:hypothetical protein MKX01_026428 [Papaver californicum]|nr:hypothetical protein MKX01_026428 [Papaver californicum]
MASTCKTDDIVGVIKKALADTLVFCYPFAGRLREAPGGKLLVECTGQGSQSGGDILKPQFPCLEQLLYVQSDSDDILHCLLLIIQVTRLVCGGFIVGFCNNHTICDAQGLHQFKTALAEIARGEVSPSILPFDVISNYEEKLPSLGDMVQHSFLFGPNELAALRQHVPPHLQACTTFEFLTAWLWRCTIATGYDPKEEVRVAIAVNTRGKFHSPLPTGFYGNAVAYPVAVSTTRTDLMQTKRRPIISPVQTYFVTDLRRVWNADEVGFGCGEAVYGGQAIGNDPNLTHWMSSYYISYQ